MQRTLASVGGTLSATCDAFDSGWGGNLAGGTHHAFRAEGSGFCVFNDIAVAIQWLCAKGRIQGAAVIDLDVHQGDGTAQVFETVVDPLVSDTLGCLALSHAGHQERDRCVIATAHPLLLPIVITLGGGYFRPIELTAQAHANTFRTASEIFA